MGCTPVVAGCGLDPKTKDPSYWVNTNISGLWGQLNGIVLSYLGRFCTSTYTAYINPGDRANWCNYCRAWGHQFDFSRCHQRVEAVMFCLVHEGEEARDEERRAWLHARTWPPLK